jgi:putative oxidoreductase
MEHTLPRWRDNGAILALTALRVGVGVIFVAHGLQKLSDPAGTAQAFTAMGIPYPHLSVYLAIAGELFGGLGLLIGFLTPLAALGPVIVMLVAIFKVHYGKGLFAQNGGWELPLTLLLVSLFFVVRGAGPISVDGLIVRLRGRRTTERRYPSGAAGSPA